MDTNTPRDNPEIDSLEWRFKRLCPNNLPWLVEIDRLRAENAELKRKLAIAVPVLEWYEGEENWEYKEVDVPIGLWAMAVERDAGEKAHEALKAMRETVRKQDVVT